MKRHEILGRNLHETREITLSMLAKGEAKCLQRTAPGQPQQQFDRERQIGLAVGHAVLEHLGYGPIERLPERLNAGVDQTLEYYFGDWWKADEDDARALDWSRPDRRLMWYSVLQDGLLLGALTGRWDDVRRICSWFKLGLTAENQFELKGYEHQQLFFAIALSLRGDPPPETEAIFASVRGCKAKRTRLLCAAWDAAVAKDQRGFDKALKESVAHFVKTDAQDVPNVCFWVALNASFVWLVAERNGLRFPALPPKLEAAVVRRETVFPAERS